MRREGNAGGTQPLIDGGGIGDEGLLTDAACPCPDMFMGSGIVAGLHGRHKLIGHFGCGTQRRAAGQHKQCKQQQYDGEEYTRLFDGMYLGIHTYYYNGMRAICKVGGDKVTTVQKTGEGQKVGKTGIFQRDFT